MNAGLTSRVLLLEWFRSWAELESYKELDLQGVCEVVFSADGYSIQSSLTADLNPSLPVSTPSNHSDNPASLSIPPRRRIVLSVNTALCYRRIVEMPSRSGVALDEALRLDLLRVTPFDPQSIFAVHRLLVSRIDSGAQKIEQLVLKRALIEPLQNLLRTRKQQLEAIVFRDESGKLWPVALTSDGKQYGATRFRFWLKALAGSFVTLAAAGLVSGLAASWQATTQNQDVAAKLAELKQRTDTILARVDAVKQSSTALRDLAGWKRGGLHLTHLVEELSRLLPDDAFLEALTIDGKSMVIEGQATSPEGLISRLEASPLLSNVAFAAPVYRNPTDAQSHFSIRMEAVVSDEASRETAGPGQP